MSLVSHLATQEKRVGMTRELFEEAARARIPQEDRWFKNEKLWLAWINKLTWPYISRISVKKVFEYCDTELARFFQATVSPTPPIDVNPVSADDVERAPKVKNLLLWQQEVGMEDFNDEWERFILNGLIYGFSPCTMDWVNRYGYVTQMVPYRLKGGEKKGHTYESKLQSIYRGPNFRSIDPYAIYLKSGTIRPRESQYLFHRMLIPYDDLMALQDEGLLKNVEKLKDTDMSLVNTDFSARVNQLLGRSVGLEWMDYDRNRDCEIIYGWFPGENYYNITAGGTVCLYEGPFPYLNSEWPYEFWTNFLFPWHWCGLSTPELVEDQQHEIMFLKNARADNRNKQLMPQFLRLLSAHIRKEDMAWSPFGVIDTTNMNGFEQVKVTDTWSQSSLLEEQKCNNEMETTVGLADVIRGAQPASRESEGSTQRRSEASGIRMGHRLQRLLNVYKAIWRKQHRYNRQFMRKDTMIRVLGEEIKGYVKVTPEEILREYDFVITPSFSYGNRGMQRQELQELIGILASIPGFQAVLQHPNMLKRLLERFDVRDAEMYVNRSPEAQRIAMQAGVGGTPVGGQKSPAASLGNT